MLFAGIAIIVVGDLCQLPPIRKRFVFDSYKNDAFNLCHPWKVFKMIELSEIMRQKNYQAFIELLNRVRTATQTEEDIRIIQSRSITPSHPNYPSNALHIWAENAPVDKHNKNKLEELSGFLFTLKAEDQYPTNVTKQDIDRVLARGRSETGGLDYKILIKEGARVMLTTNISISDRLINGQIGTVFKIDVNQNTQKSTVLYIKFDDPNAGKDLTNTCRYPFARENKVVPIEPVLAKIKIRPGKASSPEIQRVQFPITLAWACTVHKVQGLTLEKVVISLDLIKQRPFNYGQIYVALSRAISLHGLYTFGQIESKHIKANPKVLEEYQRLSNECIVPHLTNIPQDNLNVLTISLLNIRSLKKHSVDIKFYSRIFDSDIIALTETQLLLHDFDDEIVNNLIPFKLHRQDHNTDKYSSMALCTKITVEIRQCEYFPSINALKFDMVNSQSQELKTFLLLYRKQSSNILQYVDCLKYMLNSYSIDIILGDFNMNYFNDNQVQPLKSLMESFNYTQIVTKPTFISSGSLLDHVYVRPTVFKVIENYVVNVYYSDHDAIKIVVQYCN